MSRPGDLFAPGTLRSSLRRAAAGALDSGALIPIGTRSETVRDAGVDFAVRVVEGLARKERARRRPGDPFLPHEPELFVGGVSDRHICLLNKYNVMPEHLLVVTRGFADQELLPDASDFSALLRCMREFASLGFYNGGTVAGASQAHKHLQLVPLPLSPGPAVPTEKVLLAGALPFRHAWTRCDRSWLEDPEGGGGAAFAAFRKLYARCGLFAAEEDGGLRQSGPYNLLLTGEWMLVVPRAEECCEGSSVNALGFAGSLLAKDEATLSRLKAAGPMNVLRRVCGRPA